MRCTFRGFRLSTPFSAAGEQYSVVSGCGSAVRQLDPESGHTAPQRPSLPSRPGACSLGISPLMVRLRPPVTYLSVEHGIVHGN